MAYECSPSIEPAECSKAVRPDFAVMIAGMPPLCDQHRYRRDISWRSRLVISTARESSFFGDKLRHSASFVLLHIGRCRGPAAKHHPHLHQTRDTGARNQPRQAIAI